MFEGLDILIKLINQFLNENEKYYEKEFKIYIEDVYKMTEGIYSDFQRILNTTYILIKSEKMDIDDAILYLNNNRLPFKASRAKIRGIIKHPEYYKNKKAFWFAIGVVGIIEGGIHETTELFLKANINENSIMPEDKIYLKVIILLLIL